MRRRMAWCAIETVMSLLVWLVQGKDKLARPIFPPEIFVSTNSPARVGSPFSCAWAPFGRTLLFVRNVNNNSTDLAKRTSAMFVADDHALSKPSTVTLIAKAMIVFFELGALEGHRAAAAIEGEEKKKQSSPVHKNIEVTETLQAHTFENCYFPSHEFSHDFCCCCSTASATM